MYRLTVVLSLALAGILGPMSENVESAEARRLTLELTDATTGQPVADAVVIVESRPGIDPLQAEIVQKGREFRPHTLVIPRNSKVDFPNQDNTQHHVYSFSPAKTFDIELYAGRPAEPVTFDQVGVVEIGCNIHDRMQAFILVTDNEPSGHTDGQGRLTVEFPPPAGKEAGDRLLVWHPRLADNTRMTRFAIDPSQSGPLSLSVELSAEPTGGDRLDALQERFREI
ncbi:methylamine utilization protein [Marinobacter vulgaris]|uniref:Methylamine utilization protein n=1 Tax=Marinobacter vulgaris TaxID=1928331 RepID=A0A2V3ZRW9_9GAMM|nr:methylamine utilization protein [Marinobacter vulgaris]PXX92620.1 methylamine utilization protein [Marinobacter vulgaris]TSJ71437.1 methylamine utilization protein [Marinobacter vulgaris]